MYDDTFSIRQAMQNDAESISEFQHAMALETEGLTLDAARLRQGVAAVFEDPSKGTYFVAESDGIVIASLMITSEWSDWRNAWVWWIQSVYVMPSSRGKGVYAAMYAHIQGIVERQEGVLGLRLYVDKRNTAANEVYRRLGMDGAHYAMFEWMP